MYISSTFQPAHKLTHFTHIYIYWPNKCFITLYQSHYHYLSPALATVERHPKRVLQGFCSEMKQSPAEWRQRGAHTGCTGSVVDQVLVCEQQFGQRGTGRSVSLTHNSELHHLKCVVTWIISCSAVAIIRGVLPVVLVVLLQWAPPHMVLQQTWF